VRRPTVTIALLAALAAAGCGRERLDAPDPSKPFTTGALTSVTFPKAGVKFRAPADWPFGAGTGSLVASTSSGSATIAIWRYPRTEELPRDDTALQAAEENLLNAMHGRDKTLEEISTRRIEVDGAPAIQVVANETLAGRERRVRSTHAYAKGAEFVIEAYADPEVFKVVDKSVFRPFLKSFKIDPPQG
jgi:hypothetical protein